MLGFYLTLGILNIIAAVVLFHKAWDISEDYFVQIAVLFGLCCVLSTGLIIRKVFLSGKVFFSLNSFLVTSGIFGVVYYLASVVTFLVYAAAA